MAVTNLEKTDVVLIYGETRGQINSEKFPQRILPNARTFVNVVQHLLDFGRFETNKRHLGRLREDCILMREKLDILGWSYVTTARQI
jgi:hypothetical protein